MVTVRDSVFIKYENGLCCERFEFEMDDASELPSSDSISGYMIYHGSIAHDISTGKFYAIDSEGVWYAQDGSGAVTPEEERHA